MPADLMEELVRWFGGQLDEEERVAKAATPGPWAVDDETYAERIDSPDGSVIAGGRWGGEASVFESTEDAIHVSRHDPARVLRDIDADRKLIGDYLAAQEIVDALVHPDMYDVGRAQGLEEAVQRRALAFSARPGYRKEWKP